MLYEFNEQFYPMNARREARTNLRQLKHDGSIKDYVKRFIELKLQILNLGMEEAHFEIGRSKFSKPCHKGNGRGEKDERHSSDANDDGKEKLSTKPNMSVKPWEKKHQGHVRRYHCNGPHIVKKCPKKSHLDDSKFY
ncbi:hypothetical protein V6N13_056971 [Hibiscus sabdariffa]